MKTLRSKYRMTSVLFSFWRLIMRNMDKKKQITPILRRAADELEVVLDLA